MFLKDLDKRKIDRRFALTPAEFFNRFFGSYNELCEQRFSPQELFYLLEGCLHNCSNSQVTLENVLTGKVILVRYDKGLIKAYYRPMINKNHRLEVENAIKQINVPKDDILVEEMIEEETETKSYQKVLTNY